MCLFVAVLVTTQVGCSLFPESRHRDVLHNPFPQLKRVAVLPFYNQSSEPTVDVDMVAEKYYAALQAVPGFEVLPLGVAKAQWLAYSVHYGEPRTGVDFQNLARQMGVEAIVVGSVTDFQAYYPPRMAMTVHWYAANEGFHPIPAGYGLPWGTKQEKQIPRQIVREAEFELARSQLATQTPVSPESVNPIEQVNADPSSVSQTSGTLALQAPNASSLNPMELQGEQIMLNDPSFGSAAIEGDVFYDDNVVYDGSHQESGYIEDFEAPLPPAWPDPTDLIPDPPSPVAPVAITNRKPVLSHTRIYRGDDPYFTGRLADYVETGDDARSNGWQGYLKRSDDFVSFCCHLHITEMLESRGGKEQSEFILRWPLSRY
ncbi:hypothetical protein Pla22_04320 [Rubripirellula amarantea]|uniref:Uncharacterized protein n=1 Tax=Rubripirellula amarantea TaxID=2527999 RepID=A0A5C5WPL8_9BACT|nr:hypothetical protein Pla22_04320 [Rubripirellula amarantea]